MNTFLKAAAGVLIACLLCLTLSKQSKDFSILLTIAVSCVVIYSAVEFMEPIFSFFNRLSVMGKLDNDMLNILLKAVGIGLLAEIVGMISADAGNSTLGKAIQMLATVCILYLSVPIFTKLIDLIDHILSTI